MKIDNAHNIVMFDVDGTLIKPFSEASEIERLGLPNISIATPWGTDLFVELPHITDRIKRHHMQGHKVIVWSQGGHEWAELVIKALNLVEYVDLVMTKPKWYMDDLPADEWMTRTIP